jgi:tricorn protease
VINAAKGQSISKTVPMTGLTKRIDPKEEWKQIVTDAWRRQRDFFYVENMHGVDWDRVLELYLPMVDDAVSREDVSYIISEMISELNIGHAYYSGGDGGDVQDEPNRNVGLLGVDFELANGTGDESQKGYRIRKIYDGGPYDLDARGPLSMPGVNVNEGDFILAVNGQALEAGTSPFASFIGLAGRPTTLLVSDKPVMDPENKNQREVVVTPINSDAELRYRDWIAHNVEVVNEASGGRIGYIYVPNTGTEGQNDLFRQFYGQSHKDALIIDERWNGGGQIPTRFIELLNRPPTNMWARRHGRDWHWPPDAHYGPKAMLINGLAGSGGDMFPWLFRHNKLGQLIGTRTWGGLVGISGVPPLVDGGSVTVPNFGFYEMDGTWGVEGHGVDPDIEVIADPSKMQDGVDIQLKAAIDHLMAELEKNPPQKPKRPADPDRSGMGIPEEDY